MSTPSPLYTQLHQTATAHVERYRMEHLGTDIRAISKELTPDCKRHFFPDTLRTLVDEFQHPHSNATYEKHLSAVSTLSSSWTVELRDLTVDEMHKKAVAHVLISAHMKPTARVHGFEFVVTLFMTEDGTKIKHMREFVDSAGEMKNEQDISQAMATGPGGPKAEA